MPGQMPTTSSFIWGRGGRRMTPEDIAIQRRLAAQQMAAGSDYSPVGHWTQGLARVANGLAGGLQMRGADRQAQQNEQESRDTIAALLAGPVEGQPDPIAAALANPYLDNTAQQLAVKMWEQRNPKPQTPPDVVVLSQIANDPNRPQHERDAAAGRLRVMNDPQAVIPLPGGMGTYVGPQSGIASALGQPASATPTRPAPPPEAIQDLLGDPSPEAQREFDEIFGAGQAQSILGARSQFSSGPGGPVITREQADAMIAEKGRGFFDAWAQRNNVTVGN